MSETQTPVEPARTSVNPEPFRNLALWTDQSIPAWTNDLAHSLLGSPTPKIVTGLPFAPEARLTCFHRSVRWLSYHPDIPSSRLPQDSIFHFIVHLREMHPVTWAWNSIEEPPTEVTPTYMPDTLSAQVMDLNQALHDVEHTLAQDWSLWCTQSRHDGRRDAAMTIRALQIFWKPAVRTWANEPEPRHPMELPILAGAVHQDSTSEGQQNATSDVRGTPHPEADCRSRSTIAGSPQVLSPPTCELGEFAPGCRDGGWT